MNRQALQKISQIIPSSGSSHLLIYRKWGSFRRNFFVEKLYRKISSKLGVIVSAFRAESSPRGKRGKFSANFFRAENRGTAANMKA